MTFETWKQGIIFFLISWLLEKIILFSQFLVRASSVYWCECSCNWESILSAPVKRAHLSGAGDELTEQKKGCPGSVSAGSQMVYLWLQEQNHPLWVPCHTAVLQYPHEFWIWCTLLSLVAWWYHPSDGLGCCFGSPVQGERTRILVACASLNFFYFLVRGRW